MSKQTLEICGKHFDIERNIRVQEKDGGEHIDAAIVNIPSISDYEWQRHALQERIDHPEKYATFEDVPATIARLRAWLAEHAEKGATA